MTRIAFTSDLHVDYSAENREFVGRLCEAIRAASPDVLIIGGDIAAALDEFAWALNQFAELKCNKLVVAGNHDIWIQAKTDLLDGKDSGAKYNRLLPKVAADSGFSLLHDAPVIIDGIGFAGCMGWFDYSFRNQKFDASASIEKYRAGRWDHPTNGRKFIWNDMQYVWWLKDFSAKTAGFARSDLCLSDADITSFMAKTLHSQLVQLASEHVRQVITVTHFVPNRELLEYRDTVPHDYFNAYHGSVAIEEAILGCKKISHVLYGHSHVAQDRSIGGVQYHSRPVGYLGPNRVVDDVGSRLAIVEI
jgi:Icc-related predicted phosphoesterase